MDSYKRRIYLINPKFQLKVSIYICFLVFISSLIYPIVIYDLVVKLGTKLGDDAILADLKSNLLVALTLWELGFLAIIFIICIFISHRIAGPMYKLKKHLTAIKEGQEHGKIFFRKGDYFADLADDLNDAFNKVRRNRTEDVELLDEVDSYLRNLKHVVPEDKKIVIGEISEKLAQLQQRMKSES